MEWLTDPQVWIAFATLTALELVLGIDNIVFISILAGKLPVEQQKKARLIGLGLAMFMRVGLLFSLSWIIGLTAPLFTVIGQEISGRDLVLIAGGLFLIAKSTHEIHSKLEGDEGTGSARVRRRSCWPSCDRWRIRAAASRSWRGASGRWMRGANCRRPFSLLIFCGSGGRRRSSCGEKPRSESNSADKRHGSLVRDRAIHHQDAKSPRLLCVFASLREIYPVASSCFCNPIRQRRIEAAATISRLQTKGNHSIAKLPVYQWKSSPSPNQ